MEKYRGFAIEIVNGQVTIRNPANYPVVKYVGRSVEFARKLIDGMIDRR